MPEAPLPSLRAAAETLLIAFCVRALDEQRPSALLQLGKREVK